MVDISTSQVGIARQVIPNTTLSSALHWLGEMKSSFDLLRSLDLVAQFNKNDALKFFKLCYASLKASRKLILQTPKVNGLIRLQHRHHDTMPEIVDHFNLTTRLLISPSFFYVECREQAPMPRKYSGSSTVRYITWRFIREVLQLWNITETGVKLSALTRIFFICGVR